MGGASELEVVAPRGRAYESCRDAEFCAELPSQRLRIGESVETSHVVVAPTGFDRTCRIEVRDFIAR